MESSRTSPSTPAAGLGPLVAPTINLSTPVSGIAGTTVTLTGTGFTGVISVTFGGTPATSFNVLSATQITAVAPPGSGSVQIVVTTTGGTSNGVGFTYTTATPVITGLAPNQGPVAGGNTVTLTGTGFTGATVVRFGATAASFTVVSATQVTAVAPAGAAGTVNVTITTASGGTSAGVAYTYAAVPSLASVVPNQGPLSGGNSVTLTGTGFTGVTAVRFGATPATSFTVVSSTQITAVVPAGAAGPVPVTVTAAGGTTAGAVFYFYVVAPVVTAVTPDSGPLAGGNSVTITGTGLLTATAVRFGATPATSFTVISDVQINAVVPAGAAGTVAVTVMTPGGTGGGAGYTYLAVPTLTAVVPNLGPVSGGNTVTLTGSGFATAASVLFGAAPAAFSAVTDTLMTVVAPAGAAGTVNVTVTSAGGVSAGLPYTRVSPPGI